MTMTLDDRERLKAIVETPIDEDRLPLIVSYWRDSNRSNRTPREYLILHLGIVCGMCERLIADQPISTVEPT